MTNATPPPMGWYPDPAGSGAIRRILNRTLVSAMCPRRSLRCRGFRHRHDLTQPFRVAGMPIGHRVRRRVGGDRLLTESP